MYNSVVSERNAGNADAGYGYGFGAGAGMGGVGIILLFVFLLILFAVFRGGLGGHDGHYDGHYDGYGRGHGWGSVADFEAIAQNNQRVPEEQVQLAKDFGCLKNEITLGNFQLSRQISETAAAAELRACMEREADFRQKIAMLENKVMNQETLAFVNDKFCQTNARLSDIDNNMVRKVVAQPLAGLGHLQCTNIPFPPFPFNDRDRDDRRFCGPCCNSI